MIRRIKLTLLLVVAAWLLTGCGLRTLDELYCLPERSEDYNNLRSAINTAMIGLDYCAPLSGENQQTVQMADLDGDGTSEYLLFAKGTSENPLKILIFCKSGEDYVLMETIDLLGTAFDQVEYVPMDANEGYELVVGCQVSDQVRRSVSVFSFAGGSHHQLLSTNYTKFLTADLDSDDLSELFVLHPGETETDNGIAVLYGMENGTMERSVEANMSEPAEHLKRIMLGKLDGGEPAVYIASAVEDSAIITDVYALVDDRFTNVTFSNESGTSVQTLRNYYVYAEDIDGDGVIELPNLITMYSEIDSLSLPDQYVIRWYAMTATGQKVEKMYTYHNFVGGWYLQLNRIWAHRLLVEQDGDHYSFYIWNEEFTAKEKVMTLYTLNGNDREELAKLDNRFVLYRTDSVIYAASLEVASTNYGITSEEMSNAFHLIRQDWKTGETS